jgi:NCAIR mutase (PurE)-related protein
VDRMASTGERLGYATVDLEREARLGLPEVIYAPGKTEQEIIGVARSLLAASSGPVLATRVGPEVAAAALAEVPGGRYRESARLLTWNASTESSADAVMVAIVTAGTADGPVAVEASAVATAIGLRVSEFRDVGVAGLHRLLDRLPEIAEADLVIVIAGMEGALASVVAGLVAVPVIAVPTSVGYGAAFEGVTALLAMLSSCASGVTVVNIDSGFGAAMAAHRLSRTLLARAAPRALEDENR